MRMCGSNRGVLVLAVLALAANVFAQSKTRAFDAVRVPPGVNPLTAGHADSLAQQLFVSRGEEAQAESLLVRAEEYRVQSDSLWRVLDEAAQRREPLSPQDSIAALRATLEGYNKLQKGAADLQSQQEKIRLQALNLLRQSETALRKAVELNPHFPQSRVMLATVYKLLAQRQRDQSKANYDQAITWWETIVRLQPGEFGNYFQLGLNYYAVQAWGQALANFEQCEQRLLASAAVQDSRIVDPTQPVAAAVDSATLFSAAYYQAQCNIQRDDPRLNDEAQAYANLARAGKYAFTPQYRVAVDYYTNWMNWDDGHILGAKMRDSTAALSQRGEFSQAAKVYEHMIPKLRTLRARNEFGWKLAVIEFSSLNKKNQAMDRMLRIVQSVTTDSLGVPRAASRGDSLGQTYFNNFGTMCVNLGTEHRESNRKLAYTYYMQSASLNWAERGKSYLAMASLADANPRQAVADGEKAYALAHQLEPEELIILHKLLIRNYRRLGQFEKAKTHFEEMTRLLGVGSEAAPGL